MSAAAALSGLASWGSGDLAGAHRGYSTAVDGLRRAGHFSDVLGCSITLADIETTQGRLGDARSTFEDALLLAAAEEPGAVMRGTADMFVGLSQIEFERNDLQAASDHLTRAEELGEHKGLPQHPYRRRVARARFCKATGDLAGAVTLLDEAQRVYVGDFSPNVRPVPAMRTRVLVAQGRLPEALDRLEPWRQRCLAGALRGHEPEHVRRTHPLGCLAHDLEEHLQVIGHRQHRVGSATTRQELQIVIEYRHAESDNRPTPRVTRVDQTWSDCRHAGAFLSSWITGSIPGEMFMKITHISSRSGKASGLERGEMTRPRAVLSSNSWAMRETLGFFARRVRVSRRSRIVRDAETRST